MTWKILEWLEREVLTDALRDEDIVDGPKTDGSFLKHLPLHTWGFEHCPAIPYWADEHGDPDLKHVLLTVGDLGDRGLEATPTGYDGLSTRYTIDGQTRSAYDFLYDSELALDDPDDFTLSWTTYRNVLEDSKDLKKAFAATLTDDDAATESFWPTIACFGLPYNLLVLSKVDKERAGKLEGELPGAWADEHLGDLQAKGLLYEIDMSILASVKPSIALDQSVRFAPATITVLKQDPHTKALTPVAIKVWTDGGASHVYVRKSKAWLYALQAAKASITVWGIWIGHVYHWHIVTAALQMTMYNHLRAGHRLYPLLQPQSQSLIDFDFVLMSFLWGQISPPTPLPGHMELVQLLDRYAEDHTFHQTEPPNELERRGLDVDDFTVVTAWDAYPVVGYLLDIWELTGDYVTAVVHDLYARDEDVAKDGELQQWMAAGASPQHGNLRGLSRTLESRDALAQVLTSMLYRINVHGAGSLTPAVHPVLSFVSNFPPCLQRTDIPAPDEEVTTRRLLDLLPHTGTIGGMTTFYFTFCYSQPYERLIPGDGIKSHPYFPTEHKASNAALFAFREGIKLFIDKYVISWNDSLERFREAPGSPPGYAEDQYGQWPPSTEI
jgi:Lipoxygenase